MHDVISSIAARLERGADRMANAGAFAQERDLRAAAAAIRRRGDLAEALELEEQLLHGSIAVPGVRLVAFAAIEYAPPSHDPSSDFAVDSGNQPGTVHVPITSDPTKAPPPPPPSREEPEGETILIPTWPVNVPIHAPPHTHEPPENPHAQENEGAEQGLGIDRNPDPPEIP